MDVLKDSRIKKYISSFDGKSTCHYISTFCQCINTNIPKNAHSGSAKSYSVNMAELAATQGSESIPSMLVYLNKVTYFNGETMCFLICKMFDCKNIEIVDQYFHVLVNNFQMHPPCAKYMEVEYEKLLLTTHKNCFSGEMSLWDYLMDCFNKIVTGCLLYGDDQVFALAFQRCFHFCITVLQMNFEVSKTSDSRPLIMKCLRCYRVRNTKMNDITKLLFMLLNTGYDFQKLVINLATLVDQIK